MYPPIHALQERRNVLLTDTETLRCFLKSFPCWFGKKSDGIK
jgi:hypothetical protein